MYSTCVDYYTVNEVQCNNFKISSTHVKESINLVRCVVHIFKVF